MKHYREQDGCYSCVHCFVRDDHEGEDTYFCSLGAPPHPRHGGMDEQWDYEEGSFNRAYYAWHAWAKGREVQAWGICDAWDKAGESK